MKKVLRLSVVCGFALFAMGCAPDPDDVCERLEQIYKGYDEPPGFMKSREACVSAMENKRKAYGVNSYRRETECILAADRVYEVRECERGEKLARQ